MKKILYIAAAIALLCGCGKDDSDGRFRNELFVDSEHVAAEGSYVQGAQLNQFSTVTIPYQNAKGGKATISAPENNGISIAAQSVDMANGNGEATVKVSGMPIKLENTYLQLNIQYADKTYISSVEIPVMMDPDPSGTITFTIDNSPVVSLTDTKEIEFTVSPSMAAVVLSTTQPTGLAVRIEQDMVAGTGKVILTPSAQFLSGEITLTATFGVRPVQSSDIAVNGFDSGEGTSAAPYTISKASQFVKIPFGLDKSYKLTDDITVGATAPIAGVFTGKLDGNGKFVDYAINTPVGDNAALFVSLGAATVSNLTLKGSVTGQDNVAALAAANNGATLTSVDASAVVITGRNNIALLCASGTGKDAAVLTFTNTPATVNITQGTSSASVALGITPKAASVTVNLLTTGLKSSSYSTTTGELTLTMPDLPANFTAGNISLSAKLAASGAGSNVNSTVRTIAVKSEKMYESGTGVSGDPYMVNSVDQLAATMTAYPAAFITLMNDVEVVGWSTIATFTGTLDGAGYKVSKLNNPFIATLSGTVKNIKFTAVSLATTASGNIGTIANVSSGTISKVAVAGLLTRTTAGGGDQPTGGLVGEMTGGTVSDSYVNLVMGVAGNHAGGVAGRCSGSANTKDISKCTTEGTLTATAGTAFGGILGRILNTSGAITISNCNSSMVISATGATSNMVGGIFGASQPSTVNAYKIDQCMFIGRVDATAAGAGIAGVGSRISNSIVIGAGSDAAVAATVRSGGDANNYPAAGINASVKDNISNCIVASARIASINTAAVNSRNTSGICTDRNANTPTVSGCVVYNVSLPTFGRTIIGNDATLTATFGAITDNFYKGVTYYADGLAYTPIGVATIDGTAVSAPLDQAWYSGIGYDFSAVWTWDAAKGHPMLKNVGCDASVKP